MGMMGNNVWSPSVSPLDEDEDILGKGKLSFSNPEAPVIDNSPSVVEELLMKAGEAAATYYGGEAGRQGAKFLTDSYRDSKVMPTVGSVPQQNVAGPMDYLQGPLADPQAQVNTSNMNLASSNTPAPIIPMTVTDLDMNNNTQAWQNYIMNNKDGKYKYQSRFDRNGNPIRTIGVS